MNYVLLSCAGLCMRVWPYKLDVRATAEEC